MKIECNHCGTAYSVADEKVAGRKLKLRCKKCSEPIRVDGTVLESETTGASGAGEGTEATEATEAAAAAAAAGEFSADLPMATMPPPAAFGDDAAEPFEPPIAVDESDEEAVWHITVGDTTQGPYTIEELGEYYAGGSILLDTLVFRDGWSEWVPAGEVAEITGAAAGQVLPPAAPVGAQTLAGHGVTMGADPFADSGSSPDLGASPRMSAAQILSQESRTEGTVQFSIDEIRAISAVSSPSLAPAPLPGAYQSRVGMASGDASGLIDVAALAALEPSPDEPRDPRDSLIGAQASPLDTLAPLSMPLLGAPQGGGLDLRTKLFAGLGALGLVLIGGVGVLAMTYKPAPDPAVAAAAIVAPSPAVAAMAAEAPTQAAQEAAPDAPEPAADEDDGAQADADADDGEEANADDADAKADKNDDGAEREKRASTSSSKSSKRKSSSKSKAASRKAERKSSKTPERSAKKSVSIDDVLDSPSPKKSSGGSQSLDDLLTGALSGKSKPKPAEAPEPESNLPKTPSRDEMKKAYGQATAKTKKCKGDGIATAAVTIAGSGRVKSVNVTGVSGPAKSCVEKAVKSVRFPKFSNSVFEVKFPFKL